MPPQEIAPGTEHRPETFPTPLEQIGDGGGGVGPRPPDGHHGPLHGRGAFEEHRQVVAVVEKDLAGRVGRQRTAAEVVDPALRHDAHPPPGELHPPAEVDLLHVSEEIGIEAAQRTEHRGTAAKRGSAHPEDIARIVVLSLVDLGAAQDAPAAERIAQVVDEPARSARILEPAAIGQGPQLRRDGRHVRIAVQRLQQRTEPPLRRLDIGIEQNVVIGLDPRQRPVVALGESVVAAEREHLHRGELCGQQRDGAVRRSVVGHHHADPFGCGGDHPRQEPAQMLFAVPVEYDDFSNRHAACVCVSIGDATTSTIRDARRSSSPGA